MTKIMKGIDVEGRLYRRRVTFLVIFPIFAGLNAPTSVKRGIKDSSSSQRVLLRQISPIEQQLEDDFNTKFTKESLAGANIKVARI